MFAKAILAYAVIATMASLAAIELGRRAARRRLRLAADRGLEAPRFD